MITDTDLFKAFFLSCRIIYDDPIKIFRHLFRAWISFLKMNSPLRWILWEVIFLIWGVEGAFFRHFQNIYLSHLNVWLCTAFLFWQSCNCCTIAYTQHKPDFMSCMWDGPFTPGSHILHLQFVCSPCVVRNGAEAALTVLSHRSLQLIHGCLPQTHLSIVLISNPNIVTENAFSALWFFFFIQYSNTIFIDVFKCNKYKKHIIQCFLLFYF